MNGKLGLAVVGCGRIARQHLTALHDLGDAIDLVAVVSRHEEKASSYAEQYGARYKYSSLQAAREHRVLSLPGQSV